MITTSNMRASLGWFGTELPIGRPLNQCHISVKTPHTMKGSREIASGFMKKASMRRPFKRWWPARVTPQPGQCKLVVSLKRQGKKKRPESTGWWDFRYQMPRRAARKTGTNKASLDCCILDTSCSPCKCHSKDNDVDRYSNAKRNPGPLLCVVWCFLGFCDLARSDQAFNFNSVNNWGDAEGGAAQNGW